MISPYAVRVKVPKSTEALCSCNVLVMEMLEGRKLADAIMELGGDMGLAREVLRAKERDLFLGSDRKVEKVGRRDFSAKCEKNFVRILACSGS